MSSVNANAGSSKAPYNPAIDFVALAEEFKKYISFIPKFHESFKSHLNVTIVPFFVFIYLTMLKGKRVDIAHRFISRFYMRLHLINGLPPHINDLVQFKTINEARNHHYFQRFCKVSYQLVIPARSLILLMETLKVRRCTNLLVLIERLVADSFGCSEVPSSGSFKISEDSDEYTKQNFDEEDDEYSKNNPFAATVINKSTNSNSRNRIQENKVGNSFEDIDDYSNGEDFGEAQNTQIDSSKKNGKGYRLHNRINESLIRWKQKNERENLLEYKSDSEDNFESVQKIRNKDLQDDASKTDNNQPQTVALRIKRKVKIFLGVDNKRQQDASIQNRSQSSTSLRRKNRNEGGNLYEDVDKSDNDDSFENVQNIQNEELQDYESDNNQQETATHHRKTNKRVQFASILSRSTNSNQKKKHRNKIINSSEDVDNCNRADNFEEAETSKRKGNLYRNIKLRFSNSIKTPLRRKHTNEGGKLCEDMDKNDSEDNFENVQNIQNEELQTEELDSNQPETATHQINRKINKHVGVDNITQQDASITNISQSSTSLRRKHKNEGENSFEDMDKIVNEESFEKVQKNQNDGDKVGNSSEDNYNREDNFEEARNMEINTSKKNRKPYRGVGIKRNRRVDRSRKAANSLSRSKNSTSREVSEAVQNSQNEAEKINWPRCYLEASGALHFGQTFCILQPVFRDDIPIGRNDGQNLREAAVTPTNAQGRRDAVEPPAAVASTSRDPPTNHEDIPVDRIPDIPVIDLTNSDEEQDISNYSQSTAASSIVIENTSCRMKENPKMTTSTSKRKRTTSCTTESLKRKKPSRPQNTEVKTNQYKVEMIHCTMNYKGLEVVCADIDKRNSLFACGFENSTICVGTFDLAMIRGLVDLKTDYLRRSSPSNVSGTPEHFFITDFGLDHCLTGHSGAITGLAFAPSGLLMSCSDDTTARLWRLSDLRNTCVYRDHGDQIKDIAVSDNEVYFATASIDCTARLWNFERSTALINFRHSHEVEHLRFDPNCRYLATLSARRTIQLWTVEDGRSVWTIPDLDSSDVNCITISPDGKHIAYADSAGFIKVWDLSSRQLYSKGAAHKGPIYHLAYNADNSVIGSLGADRLIKVWSAKKLAPEEPVPKKRDIWMHKNLAKYFAAKFNPCFLFFHERGDILTTINSPLRSESS